MKTDRYKQFVRCRQIVRQADHIKTEREKEREIDKDIRRYRQIVRQTERYS